MKLSIKSGGRYLEVVTAGPDEVKTLLEYAFAPPKVEPGVPGCPHGKPMQVLCRTCIEAAKVPWCTNCRDLCCFGCEVEVTSGGEGHVKNPT